LSTRLNIYLDDSADSDERIQLLTNARHTVVSPRDVGTSRANDPVHLEYAVTHGCVLLTFDVDDFKALHRDWQAQGRAHSGIFVVYFENDRRRDMKSHDIIRAIDNLLASGLPIANEFHVLNQWR
jgi:hypothetical protein